MPTITFTWNSVGDATSCIKCRGLHGYSWRFTDDMPAVLVHPQFGVVYDVGMDEPRTHGNGVHGCRCWVTTEIDDSDIQEDLAVINSQTESLTDSLRLCDSEIEQFIAVLRSIT